jgi:hypothetical protein
MVTLTLSVAVGVYLGMNVLPAVAKLLVNLVTGLIQK